MFVGIFFMNTVFRLLGLLLLLYPVLLFLFQKNQLFFCFTFYLYTNTSYPSIFPPLSFSLTFVFHSLSFFTHFRFSLTFVFHTHLK